jgi:hypothetical protein
MVKRRKHYGFISFWWTAFIEGSKKSWETGFGRGVEAVTFISGFCLIRMVWKSKHDSNFDIGKWEDFMNYWVAAIPLGVGFLWFVGHIFYQPYKIYKDQEDRHREVLDEVLTEKVELQRQLDKKLESDKLVLDKQTAKELLGYKLFALQNPVPSPPFWQFNLRSSKAHSRGDAGLSGLQTHKETQ